MGIIADRFTTPTEIPGFGIVPIRQLQDARLALGVGETVYEAFGCRTRVTGSFTNPEGFTLAECVEILEAVFGGTFGADARVETDGTFWVDAWSD